MSTPDRSVAYEPSILGLVASGVGRDPGAPAVSDDSRTLTYAELIALANGVRAALVRLGVSSGELVLIETPLCRWAVPAMLGVLLAGCCYVPLDERLPSGRRAAVREQTGSRFRLCLAADDAGLRLDGPAGAHDVEPSTGGDPSTTWDLGQDRPDCPAYVMYTSGSTGRPKGVVVSRAALGYSTRSRFSTYGHATRPTLLLCSSLSFDTSVASIYWALATGGHLVVPSRFPGDAAAIGRACRAHRGSHVLLLPTVLALLLDGGAEYLSSLRTVIVCGEVCPPSLVSRISEALPEATLWNEYGPTEATVWSTVHRCQPGEDPVPIGRPLPGTTAHIRGAEGDKSRDGELGELWLSGPGLATGYVDDPGSDRFAWLDGERAYRTGDLVSRTTAGVLHYHGRVDSQVKVGGVRLELEEIEHRLQQILDARAAVGVARKHPTPGELVLFVEAESVPTVASLRRDLLVDFPSAVAPRKVVPVTALPELTNGKLDRRRLDAWAEEQAHRC